MKISKRKNQYSFVLYGRKFHVQKYGHSGIKWAREGYGSMYYRTGKDGKGVYEVFKLSVEMIHTPEKFQIKGKTTKEKVQKLMEIMKIDIEEKLNIARKKKKETEETLKKT